MPGYTTISTPLRLGAGLLALALGGCPQGPPLLPATNPAVQVHEPNAHPAAASARPSMPAVAPASPAAAGSPSTPVASPSPPPAVAQTPVPSVIADVAKADGIPLVASHHVTVSTTQGDFTIVLFPDRAGRAVIKFLQAVQAKVYDGTTFHRVIPGFVAQGGDPNSKTRPYTDPSIGYGTWGDPVPDDFDNGLKHLYGSVALAHSGGANSSSVQFYVCLAALPSLDGKYIVFGQVLSGMDVVGHLAPTEVNGKATGAPPDRINHVVQAD